MRLSSSISTLLAITLFVPTLSWSEDKAPAAPKEDPNSAGEMLEVEKVKEKYWAQGKDSKMGVVQNRLFSKEGKFALGVIGGVSMSDPFLAIKNYGFNLGYHFTEFVGVEGWWWKNSSGPSAALIAARKTSTVDVSVPDPSWASGLNVLGSVLYGKLSFVGQKIIYYDMHVTAGLGAAATEYQKALFAWNVGLGQRFYITQYLSLRMDYKMISFREEIREEVITNQIGDVKERRNNFTHSINGSLEFMF
jgi:outer membrane beta-barrel protein